MIAFASTGIPKWQLIYGSSNDQSGFSSSSIFQEQFGGVPGRNLLVSMKAGFVFSIAFRDVTGLPLADHHKGIEIRIMTNADVPRLPARMAEIVGQPLSIDAFKSFYSTHLHSKYKFYHAGLHSPVIHRDLPLFADFRKAVAPIDHTEVILSSLQLPPSLRARLACDHGWWVSVFWWVITRSVSNSHTYGLLLQPPGLVIDSDPVVYARAMFRSLL